MEVIRKRYIEQLYNAITTTEQPIFLAGTSGSGKQVVIKQFFEYLKREDAHYRYVHCDFATQYPRNPDPILNLIHQLANVLEHHSVHQEEFKLVDYIYCEKFNMLPRDFFTADKPEGVISSTLSIANDLTDLASLNVGSNVIDVGKKIYKLLKDISYQQTIKTLKAHDQAALIQDFTDPLFKENNGQLILVLSHFDGFSAKEKDYLASLTQANTGVRFVFVGQQTCPCQDCLTLAVEGFDQAEVASYLQERLEHPEELMAYLADNSGVAPSYLDAFCTLYIQHQGSPASISQILDQDVALWKSISQNLSQDQKDILVLLSLCDQVDMFTFERFFENLYFGNYLEWFQGPLFVFSGRSVQLKHYYINAIKPMHNPLLLYAYEVKLFRVYQDLLQGCIQRSQTEAIHQYSHKILTLLDQLIDLHQQNPLDFADVYAMKFGFLNAHWPMTAAYGLDAMFIAHYEGLYPNLSPHNQLICRARLITAYISRGLYTNAEQYLVGEDVDTLEPTVYLLRILKASLIYYQNRPAQTREGKRYDIFLAEKLLDMYQSLEMDLDVKYADFIDLNIYIAKAYMAGIDNNKARPFLDRVLEIPSEAILILHLYKNMAKYYMVSGELYHIFKDTEKEMAELANAVNYYKCASFFDGNDLEVGLDLGLAHKRLSEYYKKRKDVAMATDEMDQAIAAYLKVKQKNPDMIDIYQKLGYAHCELAEFLLQQGVDGSAYCQKAIEYLQEGVCVLSAIGEDHRQIRNALCLSYRVMFQISGDVAYLAQSLAQGRKSIACAPENALGYMEFIYTAAHVVAQEEVDAALFDEVASYVAILETLQAFPSIIQAGKDVLAKGGL